MEEKNNQETLDMNEAMKISEDIMKKPITVDPSALGDNSYACVNVMEQIVKQKILATMDRLGICTCSQCLNDCMAFTLNNLKPKYVVTKKGELFAKLNSYTMQYTTDLISAMTKACVIVKNSPRHPPGQPSED